MKAIIGIIVCNFFVILITVNSFYRFSKKWVVLENIGIIKVSKSLL